MPQNEQTPNASSTRTPRAPAGQLAALAASLMGVAWSAGVPVFAVFAAVSLLTAGAGARAWLGGKGLQDASEFGGAFYLAAAFVAVAAAMELGARVAAARSSRGAAPRPRTLRAGWTALGMGAIGVELAVPDSWSASPGFFATLDGGAALGATAWAYATVLYLSLRVTWWSVGKVWKWSTDSAYLRGLFTASAFGIAALAMVSQTALLALGAALEARPREIAPEVAAAVAEWEACGAHPVPCLHRALVPGAAETRQFDAARTPVAPVRALPAENTSLPGAVFPPPSSPSRERGHAALSAPATSAAGFTIPEAGPSETAFQVDRCIQELLRDKATRDEAVREARKYVIGIEAEDVVHETALLVCGKDRGIEEIRPYFFKALQNNARKWRKTERQRICELDEEHQPACDPDGTEETWMDAERGAFQHAWSCALTESDRSALTRQYLEGLSSAEAAALEGVTPAAFRKRVERALQKIRDRVKLMECQ